MDSQWNSDRSRHRGSSRSADLKRSTTLGILTLTKDHRVSLQSNNELLQRRWATRHSVWAPHRCVKRARQPTDGKLSYNTRRSTESVRRWIWRVAAKFKTALMQLKGLKSRPRSWVALLSSCSTWRLTTFTGWKIRTRRSSGSKSRPTRRRISASIFWLTRKHTAPALSKLIRSVCSRLM